jgi:hypothetical protein
VFHPSSERKLRSFIKFNYTINLLSFAVSYIYNEVPVIRKLADGNFNPKNLEVAGFVRRMKKMTELTYFIVRISLLRVLTVNVRTVTNYS